MENFKTEEKSDRQKRFREKQLKKRVGRVMKIESKRKMPQSQ